MNFRLPLRAHQATTPKTILKGPRLHYQTLERERLLRPAIGIGLRQDLKILWSGVLLKEDYTDPLRFEVLKDATKTGLSFAKHNDPESMGAIKISLSWWDTWNDFFEPTNGHKMLGPERGMRRGRISFEEGIRTTRRRTPRGGKSRSRGKRCLKEEINFEGKDISRRNQLLGNKGTSKRESAWGQRAPRGENQLLEGWISTSMRRAPQRGNEA